MADFEDTNAPYDDGGRYERRDRSASPRGEREDRNRSRSPMGRDRPPPPPGDTRMKDADDEGAINSGTNLFVTGIHPRLTEADVSRLFDKYGEVTNCSIMLDPHTKESRGFGFVNMAQPEQADAAKEGLQGENIEGRTLSIEKARRARPRTPTPGKYFGPPKRGDFGSRGPPRGGGYRDRYDDRRGGGGYRGGGYRDDYRGGRGYDDYDRRGYGGGRRDRDDSYGSRNIDRYESRPRDDGYAPPPRERRGGGGGYYSREERGGGGGGGGGADDRAYTAPPARDEAPREYGGSSRGYDREDRYSGR